MDRDFLIDLFADFGPVTIRRMFSGYGISADGTNFALALRAGLYLRADDQTIPQFEAEGSQPFQYQTRTKTVTVNSYWQLPARLFDDFRRAGRLGEGGAGRGAARGASQTAQGAQGGKAEGYAGCNQAGYWSQGGEDAGDQDERAAQVIRFASTRGVGVRRPGCGSRRRIRGRLRRSRGCGRCAWRRRGRHRRVRSANRCHRRASAWKRRPRW